MTFGDRLVERITLDCDGPELFVVSAKLVTQRLTRVRGVQLSYTLNSFLGRRLEDINPQVLASAERFFTESTGGRLKIVSSQASQYQVGVAELANEREGIVFWTRENGLWIPLVGDNQCVLTFFYQ